MDHVASVSAKAISVRCSSAALHASLSALGATDSEGFVLIPYSSKQGLAAALTSLQQLGIPFGHEPAGWPPAAVFQQLRSEGLVTGSIKTVCWRSPSKAVLGSA